MVGQKNPFNLIAKTTVPKNLLFYILLIVCLCECVCTPHANTYMYRAENSFLELVLFFYHVSPGMKFRFLSGKHFDSLSIFASPLKDLLW